MALSLDQIYSVAREAGFPRDTAVKMVAIAIKESGGNPYAHNAKPPDDSYGLWQINMLGALGPSRRQQLGIQSNDALFDPAVNARMAYILWAGSDSNLARHWYITMPGYNSNKFNEVLPAARAAADRVDGTVTATIPPDVAAPGGDGSDTGAAPDDVSSGAPPVELQSSFSISPTMVWVGVGFVAVALIVDFLSD